MRGWALLLTLSTGVAAAQSAPSPPQPPPEPELTPAPRSMPELQTEQQAAPRPMLELQTGQTPPPRPMPERPNERQPPAPLLLPELAPRTRFVISPLVSSGLLINMLQLGVGGTYAIQDLELFGEVRARLAGIVNIGGRAQDSNGAFLGNVRAGARYHARAGHLRIAPAAWAWLPSSNAPIDDHRLYVQMSGADNWRAYGPRATALGLAVDVAWHQDARFVQAQLGTAIVSDGGAQVDNVFGAIGFGTQASARTSFLAEWRVDVLPTRQRMHGPAIGVGRGDGRATSWRMRLHPYLLGDGGWGGLAFAFDIIQRF